MAPPSPSLRRNTGWMFVGQSGKLLIQGLYFVLMARNLGPRQYGSFIAITAVAAMVAPFVGNGAGQLMIKSVARDPGRLPQWLGNAFLLTTGSGVVFSLILVPACRLALPGSIPLPAILLVIVSDMVLCQPVNVASWAFQAVEQLGWTANLNLFASLSRLLGIVVIVLLQRPTLVAWAVAYLVTSLLCAVFSVTCVVRKLGWPDFTQVRGMRGELREGLYFSIGLSAQTIYNDIDKTMLARMASLEAAGLYAAAYRLIDVAFIPVRSILYAAYPGFFRSGQQGIGGTVQFARRLLPRTAAYSGLAAAALLVAAPVVPRILGQEYAHAAIALRWLALLPVLKTLHSFAADSLTGAGYQGLRSLLQISVAMFNASINLWLIPAYSWCGAAWSSLASDGLLALSLWTSVALLRARSRKSLTARASRSFQFLISDLRFLIVPGARANQKSEVDNQKLKSAIRA